MGNCATCHCNNQGESNELLTEDPVNRNTKDAAAVRHIDLREFRKHIKLIVKLQAWTRGCITRRRIYQTLVLRDHGKYAGGNDIYHGEGAGFDSEEDGLEERDEYVFKNGARYKGQWKGNVRHGYGTQVWPDGARYEGYWKNNKADGKGTFWHVDGDIFEGEWKEDKANGYGIYTHMNGAKYEGYWKDDLQHGFGIETWTDGSKYEGHYNDGKKHG